MVDRCRSRESYDAADVVAGKKIHSLKYLIHSCPQRAGRIKMFLKEIIKYLTSLLSSVFLTETEKKKIRKQIFDLKKLSPANYLN